MAERRHFLCGSLAGISASLILQPLDVIKTSILVQHQANTMYGAVLNIYERQGLSGLWRGSAAAFFRSLLGGGLNFFLLETFKIAFASEEASIGRFATDSQSAALARGIAIILQCPLSVIKIRMEALQSERYNSIRHAMMRIYFDEGFRGFYRGISANLLRDVPYAGLAYAFYDQYITFLGNLTGMENGHPKYQSLTFVAGCLAGLTSAIITQPFDIIKTRFMFKEKKEAYQHDNPTLFGGLGTIWRREGLKGLTRGIHIRIFERSCSYGILWFIYEKAKIILNMK